MLKKTAFLFLLCAAPSAFAFNNRSAVSLTGLDTNACTVASPCRSFGAAIAVTSPSGEIIALDSAGYGPFTINGPVTISGAPGVHAAITATNGAGIAINAAASDHIILRNLVLIGGGGASGIESDQSGKVRVLNCLVRGFSIVGVYAASGQVVIDRTSVLDQSAVEAAGIVAGDGINATDLTVTNSLIEGNDTGVFVSANASAIIASCAISNSASRGVAVESIGLTTQPPAAATLESNTISFNGIGVESDASGGNSAAAVYLAQNVVAYNGQGIQANNNSNIFSFGNNRFTVNTPSGDGDPPTPIAMQ